MGKSIAVGTEWFAPPRFFEPLPMGISLAVGTEGSAPSRFYELAYTLWINPSQLVPNGRSMVVTNLMNLNSTNS